MSYIEETVRNATAKTTRLISTTPAALRECAARLETAMGQAVRGQAVLCELASGITLAYFGEERIARRALADPDEELVQ